MGWYKGALSLHKLPKHKQHHQLLHGIRWAAERLGSDTLSFELMAPDCMLTLRLLRTSGLEDKISGNACHLRCFSFEVSPSSPSKGESKSNAATCAFIDVFNLVLKQAPHIETLQILGTGPRHFCTFGTRLQHLKHLVLGTTFLFEEGLRPDARLMLPSLETLYLHRKSQSVGVSVLGLQHLRRLVVKGKHVLEALHDPSCQLYVHGDGYAMRLSKSKPLIPGRRSLGATSDFIIGGCNYMGGPANPTYPESLATRGHWADMETLTVKWPLDWHVRNYGPKDFTFKRVCTVLECCTTIHMQAIRIESFFSGD